MRGVHQVKIFSEPFFDIFPHLEGFKYVKGKRRQILTLEATGWVSLKRRRKRQDLKTLCWQY